MCFKALALLGMMLTSSGTILLWRSSPAGYSPGAYMFSPDMSTRQGEKNQSMAFYQKLAIALIVVGTALQVPLVLN